MFIMSDGGQMERVGVLSIFLVNSHVGTWFMKSIDVFDTIKKMGN